ncbi:MAG: proline iminopeptidase [Paraglaciecola sp.]|jgi:proline iminopeptidase
MRLLILFCTTLLLFSCKETPKTTPTISPKPKAAATDKVTETGGLIAINDTQLYLKTIGKGEPILFVHGGPGLDHTYFLPQLQALAKDHELIFYDQRASGKSASNLDSTQISMDIFVDDIEAIRKKTKQAKLNILGHSFGGILAMKYAIKYPEKVNKLILSNSSGASAEFMQNEAKRLQERITEDDQFEQQLIFKSKNFQAGKASAYENLFRIFFRKEFVNRELADSLTLTFPNNFVQNSRLLGYLNKDMGANYDFHQDLKKITAPTLVVYGDYEILAESAGKQLAENIPNAKFTLIEDCGHFPFVEKPKAYFSEINEFLR